MPEGPRILCVHGSPRKGGNTDLLLDRLAQGATDAGAGVEHLYCRDLKILPCTGCGACAVTGECVITGDDMAVVYARFDGADAVAVGAPVYFLGPPAPLKAMIDRFQTRWSRLHVLGRAPERTRPGAVVSTAGTPVHSVFTCFHRVMEAWFEVLGVEGRMNLFFEGVDARGAVRSHPGALDEALAAGERLAREAARGREETGT